jgi:hypothetical protein
MYGWERKNGRPRDHWAEETTEDDVMRALNQTKTALLTPSTTTIQKSYAATKSHSEVMLLPSPPPPDAAARSYDVWTDAKADGIEAYTRGDFTAAAVCFAAAAAMLTTHHATRITSLASSASSDLITTKTLVYDATLDAHALDDDDEVGLYKLSSVDP